MEMRMRVTAFLRPAERYEGVRPLNIYLLRLLFLLVFVFVGYDAWSYILRHEGPWDPVRAAAYCMWGAYALLSALGILYPLRFLPLVMFEIVYKIAWLLIVAYPLWKVDALAGSPAEGMTTAFLWVILPIIAMPWTYFGRTYVVSTRAAPVSSIGVAT
jgi:hypothetical protein